MNWAAAMSSIRLRSTSDIVPDAGTVHSAAVKEYVLRLLDRALRCALSAALMSVCLCCGCLCKKRVTDRPAVPLVSSLEFADLATGLHVRLPEGGTLEILDLERRDEVLPACDQQVLFCIVSRSSPDCHVKTRAQTAWVAATVWRTSAIVGYGSGSSAKTRVEREWLSKYFLQWREGTDWPIAGRTWRFRNGPRMLQLPGRARDRTTGQDRDVLILVGKISSKWLVVEASVSASAPQTTLDDVERVLESVEFVQ